MRFGDPIVSFFVAGRAAPGGSKRPVKDHATGKVRLVDMGKHNAKWKREVARIAREVFKDAPLCGPLAVTMRFVRQRPKCHYFTGRNAHLLRPDAPPFPTVAPDVLKTARSTEDALNGVVWKDDAQTVSLCVSKSYGDTPGVQITVSHAEGT